MPRYFFHVRDGVEHIDHTGVELSDLNEARTQAVIAAGEGLQDYGKDFWDGTEWSMWVTDEAGQTLFGLRFSAEMASSCSSAFSGGQLAEI